MFKFNYLALIFVLLFPVMARADYFVWSDPDSGLTLTYPDTWALAADQQPDDVVTIKAPSGRDQAMCRVRVRNDGRYLVYPPRFSESIQKVAYSGDFWDTYLHGYKDPVIYTTSDSAGLGRGFAGYAEAEYQSAVPGPVMKRRALMFATLYNGSAYIFECSSHADAFSRWKGLFLSVSKSVDFAPAHHQLDQGNYPRNFFADQRLIFRTPDNDSAVMY